MPTKKNHLHQLSDQLRALAAEIAIAREPVEADVLTDDDRLRAAAWVLEQQPCEHVPTLGLRIEEKKALSAPCQYCGVRMIRKWVAEPEITIDQVDAAISKVVADEVVGSLRER